MLTYPNIDPVAISLGPLQVHWYGLMYLLAFLFAWGLATFRAKQRGWTPDMVSDLIFFGALGVIIGGRVGYVPGRSFMAVPDLDRRYEFPRRFPRGHSGHVVVV